MRKHAWVLYVVLLGAGASMGSCSGRFGSICDEAEKCASGNDQDYETCLDQLEALEELASVNNCDEEFDDWFSCFEENNDCEQSGDDEDLVPESTCDDEGDDLGECID